jgi:DNA repair exonuclease SbcCD nuclease subunit
MVKIAHIADLHLSGKNYDKAKEALSQVSKKFKEIGIDYCVLSGDVFDKHNISDRFKTVGDLQGLLLDFIRNNTCLFIVFKGNHDVRGAGKTALEFLRVCQNVKLVEKPDVLDIGALNIGILPWIDKGIFYANKCQGLDKTASELAFNKNISDILGYFKAKFDNGKPSLLYGHLEIAGLKVNDGYMIENDSFTFNEIMLYATGASVISLGHIHKREGYYAGALFQQSFGDEGNPQGFEWVEVRDNDFTEHYEELDLPKFMTLAVDHQMDVPGDLTMAGNHSLKLRFSSEEAYNYWEGLHGFGSAIVEKLWNKKEFVARDSEINATLSDNDLLSKYIDLNAVPEGITKQDLLDYSNLEG